jgi:hypothetical protein
MSKEFNCMRARIDRTKGLLKDNFNESIPS